MLIKLARYLHGYIRIRLRTGDSVRLLNRLGKEEIYFWGTQTLEDGVVLSIFDKDYPYFLYVAQMANAEIRSEKRKGVKFYIKSKSVKRGILIGMLTALALFLFSQFCILDVTITGNEKVSLIEIENVLDELNIKPYTFHPKFNGVRLAEQVQGEISSLSWAAVNKHGSRVDVIVRERKIHEELTPKTPCNIIAGETGIIRYIKTKAGKTLIPIDQTVKKGDIIVSGVLETPLFKTYYVHANAEVYAEVEHKKSYFIDMKKANIVYTDKNVKKRFVHLFGKEIPLSFSSDKDKKNQSFDEIINTQRCKIFGLDLGFDITTKTRNYYKPAEEKFTIEDAKVVLSQNIDRYEIEELRHCKIVTKEEKFKTKGDKLRIDVTYILEKDIAMESEIILE